MNRALLIPLALFFFVLVSWSFYSRVGDVGLCLPTTITNGFDDEGPSPELASLKRQLAETQNELARLKAQQNDSSSLRRTDSSQPEQTSAPPATTTTTTTTKDKTNKEQNDASSSESTPDEFHRYEHLVTTSKVLHQSQTRNLFHMDPIMRRSRPVVGNTERLQGFIQKLLDGKCTICVFVGGSVTFAMPDNRGGFRAGYHKSFVQWLNERYPCQGGQHQMVVHGPGGTDSAYAGANFNQLFRDANGPVDFVSFEYAVNDSSMSPKPNRGLSETIQINNEILFRKALKYRNPQDGSAPVVLSLETSFFQSNLKNRDTSSTYSAVHVFAAAHHFPIMTYYDIPTVSAAQVWFPMFAKDLEMDKDTNSTIHNVFRDTCHPSAKGHLIIAQLMAYNLEIEKAWMQSQNSAGQRHDLEKDLSLQDPPKLPIPWWLTDEEEALLVDAPVSEFDFQKHEPVPDTLYHNTGWKVYADVKSKFGLIATQSASHVSFKIDLFNFNRTSFGSGDVGGGPEAFKKTKMMLSRISPTNKITLGFLKTYAKISKALVWTDDNPDGRDYCNRTATMATSDPAPRNQIVDPLHNFKTSVYGSFQAPLSPTALDAAEKNQSMYVHLCSLPESFEGQNVTRPYVPVDGDSKFKLLLVSVINGHVRIDKSGDLKKVASRRR